MKDLRSARWGYTIHEVMMCLQKDWRFPNYRRRRFTPKQEAWLRALADPPITAHPERVPE